MDSLIWIQALALHVEKALLHVATKYKDVQLS
jgi:hypothetical protein